jgi:D-serine deaminase-like pyridoxal phosphate-dependent protein
MFPNRNIGNPRGEASNRVRRHPGADDMPILVADLDTPAVVIDLDIVEANIKRAQDTLSGHGLANRPHIKTHKIPALAKMQIDAGAVGITCQKLGEVEVMADAGAADDILLTYNVLGEAKGERLAALIRRLKRMAVVLDNDVVARGLSDAGKRHGVDIRYLIECDTGYGRNGVQSPQAALDLAQRSMRLPNMRFEGLMTFPTAKPEQRQWLERALQLLNGAGIATPVVSGGGSPSLKDCGDFPMLTEYRAGTYIYNDVMQVTAGAATWDDCAMTVRATVVSRPTEDRAVLDAGSKVMTYEQYYAKGFGRIVEYPDAQVTGFSEEHGIVDLSGSAKKPKIGEVVSVIPNHCCVVTNMMDEVYAARKGVVEAVYPVAARGKVR